MSNNDSGDDEVKIEEGEVPQLIHPDEESTHLDSPKDGSEKETDKDKSSTESADEASHLSSREVYRVSCSYPPPKGESFCECHKSGNEDDCTCGEEESVFDWKWDTGSKSSASLLMDDDREVKFHVDYSCGTAAVCGTLPMENDQHYWEIKMTTPVYGTDMMVGIGTLKFAGELDKFKHTFCSMLGRDQESWGLSYTGQIYHSGSSKRFSSQFSQGSIIGVHLDMWKGSLTFYKNRKYLGTSYSGLQGKILLPVISSTAARSGMKVIRAQSFNTSLQFMCCQVLRKNIPEKYHVSEVLNFPPGLDEFLLNNLDWLLRPCVRENKVSRKKKQKWPDIVRTHPDHPEIVVYEPCNDPIANEDTNTGSSESDGAEGGGGGNEGDAGDAGGAGDDDDSDGDEPPAKKASTENIVSQKL